MNQSSKKPLALIILDGFGIAPAASHSAIAAAEKPNIDRLFAENPFTVIGASGVSVGLPDGQMGNSEVGHTNIGAGRVVYQELTRISKSISDGDFFENKALLEAVENAKKSGGALHLMGLLSDGGVHSHISHLFALLKLANDYELPKVYVHCLLDGRDVSPSSGLRFVKQLQNEIEACGTGEIATVIGRYYAMDRDNRFDRVKKAYDAIVDAKGDLFEDAAEVVQQSYGSNVTDEFVLPSVCKGYPGASAGDSFIFFNFRPDRAREITRAFSDRDFDGFIRDRGFLPVNFVCMTQYDTEMPGVSVAFLPQSLEKTLPEVLCRNHLKQLRIAETEKYAHVTFFFNSGIETPFEGEERCLIPSPKIATYDLQPEMSAPEVADEFVRRVQSGEYDVLILNFANCDMVGHTGNFAAAKASVEAVDKALGKAVSAVLEAGGIALITADHGNADCMLEPDGSPFTAHTINPVPFCVAGHSCSLREGGILADIAPTMLELLGIEKPDEMDGKSLLANEI